MDKNLVLFGLENVHIAFQTGSAVWGEVFEIPGAVNFATTPQSEQIIFHADNKRYFVRENNNGYTGNLEMALFPDEIKKRMLGWEIDQNGMLIEVADGKPEKFALMGQVLGDARNRRFVYYDVMGMRHGQDSATKGDTIDPDTQTMPVMITPIKIDGLYVVKGDIELSETNEDVFEDFFDRVTLPFADPLILDTEALDAVIDLADNLTYGDYTEPSWTAFAGVLVAAKGVQGDPKSQKEIFVTTRKLQEAFFKLELV